MGSILIWLLVMMMMVVMTETLAHINIPKLTWTY
jgi:hypothetical protein